jgi:VanZ family protein
VSPRSRLILKYWTPALLWTAIVLYGSGDVLSAEHTVGWMEALLERIGRRLPPETLAPWHFAFRKLGHLIAYFAGGALFFRALRGEEGGWRGRWAAGALALTAAVAAADEWHQMFVATRTGNGWDVVLDCVGGALAQAIARWRTRKISRFEVRMKN